MKRTSVNMGSVKAIERDVRTQNKWNHHQLLKAVRSGNSRLERQSGRPILLMHATPKCWLLWHIVTCGLIYRPAPAAKVHAASHLNRKALSLQALAIMPCM